MEVIFLLIYENVEAPIVGSHWMGLILRHPRILQKSGISLLLFLSAHAYKTRLKVALLQVVRNNNVLLKIVSGIRHIRTNVM